MNSYERLIQIVSMNEEQIIDYLSLFLHEIKGKNEPIVDSNGDFLYLQSDLNHICLVAHIDHVRPDDCEPDIIINNGIMRNRRGVLGADDRAGVFALTEIALHIQMYGGTMPSILFCNHEEVGCVGSYAFMESGVLNTDELRIFIEFDRQRQNEYVSYWRELPMEVKSYLESYGYVQSTGTGSDVIVLGSTNIPAVNLSIGFSLEHTRRERLNLKHMELNIQRGVVMCQNPIDRLYPVEESQLCKDVIEMFERWEIEL